MLLLLRARAHSKLGNAAQARHDLDTAIARTLDAPDADAFHLHAAETALALNDVDLAERQLDAIVNAPVHPEFRHVLRGRIAFVRRDSAAMERAFREAVALAPAATNKLLGELALRLVRLDRMRDAVTIFEEIGWEALLPELRGDYVGALVASNDLLRAAKLAEEQTASPDAPDWALHIASEFAARQGNAPRAVELLARVAGRHPEDVDVAFELARRVLLMRRPAEARPYIDELLAHASELDPAQKMAVAHLLREAGRRDEAVALGFAAFRSAPHDAAMHREFGNLLLFDPQPVEHPGYVTADTYVKLTSDTGDEREYVIYAEPPVDPRSHEMLLAQAESVGYAGKSVGDIVVHHAGTWQEQRWTVTEILPAIVYVFRDIMAGYEKRFEGERFYVRMFRMTDEPSVTDLAPLLSSLHARRSQAESVFKIYRERVLPLGLVAGMLDVGVAEVMACATTEELGPLAVEWFDAEGQDASRTAAHAATDVVLTRSALETIADLELLDAVRNRFKFIAPHSLLEALERELLDAEAKCASGQHTIWSGETGLHSNELTPDHPMLVARMERARLLLNWTRANVRAEFRPLETIGAPNSDKEKVRATIGDHSLDAVRLTEHLGITMLADDLGLRRFLPKGSRGQTFSCVSLIPELAERGAISVADRDRLLLRLVDRRYVTILPTRSLLLASVHPSQVSAALARDVFALLGGPAMDLPSAAFVVAEVLRGVTLAPLQFAGLPRIVTLALDGMSRRWPARLCAYALTQAATTQLTLMPRQFKEVREAVAAYLKGS